MGKEYYDNGKLKYEVKFLNGNGMEEERFIPIIVLN